MSEDKIKPTSKKGLNALTASLKVFDAASKKAKLTAKQFALVGDVKVKIKGVKKGLVTPDKLLQALNKMNKALKATFKL